MEVTPSSPQKRNRSSPPSQEHTKPQTKLHRAGKALDVFLSKKKQTTINPWTAFTSEKGLGRGSTINNSKRKKLVGAGRGNSTMKGRRLIKPFSRLPQRNLTRELDDLSDMDDGKSKDEEESSTKSNSSEEGEKRSNNTQMEEERKTYYDDESSTDKPLTENMDDISQELHEVKSEENAKFEDADETVKEIKDEDNNGLGVAKRNTINDTSDEESHSKIIIKGKAPDDLVSVDNSQTLKETGLKATKDKESEKNDQVTKPSNQNEENMETTNPGRTTFNANGNDSSNEDDIDTQASEGTVAGNRPSSQEILPAWTRYHLIVNIPPVPPSILAKKLKGETIPAEYENNDLRLFSSIKSFFCHIKSFDDTAMIIEWSSKDDESQVEGIILPEALPTATSELQTFFDGFKGKDTGAVYLRIRVISKFPPREFAVNCDSWLKSNKCSLMKCPIQTEESTDIGFLGYTSQYNDKDYIAKQLSKICEHEIGVRLAAVANRAEHDLDWKKKTKGLIVVAPSELAESAKNKLTTVFMARKAVFQSSTNNPYNIFHTLSFLPLEQDVAKMPNCTKNFTICLQRHQVHYKSIRVRFSTDIITNIHKKVTTPKGRFSLRQMILQIESNAPKTKGAKIFQSVDYIHDGSKVYFPNMKKNGPKKEGYVFQFYQSMENEAIAMIRGLGVYLASSTLTKPYPSCSQQVIGIKMKNGYGIIKKSALSPQMKD